MPIGTKGLTGLSLMFLLTMSFHFAHSQVDTVNIRPFERYWTKPRLVPKVGFGVQETGFGEIGLQLHQIFVHPLSLASAGPYFTVDGVFQSDQIIVGPKLGYELTAGLLGIAGDVTYYSDFNEYSLIATPKAGITLFGYINLFYGRNLKLSDETFNAISPNRFSIIFNLNPDYHNIREATKQKRRANHD